MIYMKRFHKLDQYLHTKWKLSFGPQLNGFLYKVDEIRFVFHEIKYQIFPYVSSQGLPKMFLLP